MRHPPARPPIPAGDIWWTAVTYGSLFLLGLMAQLAEAARIY